MNYILIKNLKSLNENGMQDSRLTTIGGQQVVAHETRTQVIQRLRQAKSVLQLQAQKNEDAYVRTDKMSGDILVPKIYRLNVQTQIVAFVRKCNLKCKNVEFCQQQSATINNSQ